MKFRKKPVVIEAVQFLPDPEGVQKGAWPADWPVSEWLTLEMGPDALVPKLVIPTLEGDITASPGDWIIRGIKGEFYPCRNDIFEATYEPVEPKKATEPEACSGCGERHGWRYSDDLRQEVCKACGTFRYD